MMPMNQMSQIDEVRKILLSLLLSRKGPTTIAQLEKEYEGMEGKPVPYRQFDCKDFLSFLESMPAHFTVEPYGNTYNIRGIASEKSKHVSSLVARQKSDQRRYPPPHLRPQFSRRPFKLPPQRVRIASDKLLRLMNYVKSNPNGVSLDHAANYVQKMVPYVMVNKEDLRQQLRELMHQLVVDGNMIYPVVWGNGLPSTSREQPPPLMDQPVLLMEEALLARSQVLSESPSDSASPPTMRIECPAGLEDTDWQHFGNDDNDFVSAGCRVSSRRTKTSEHLVTNLAQHARSKQTDMFNYKVKDDIETSDDDEYFSVVDSKSNTEMKIQDASDMISDRTKSRLEKLLQKHPEGIWCAELPDKYLDEYKVRLSYTKLGFSSVREYTSYLPHIFYMTQTKKTDDFLLFNADKRPIVPKTDPIDIAQSLSKYDEHGTGQAECNNNDDDAPIPSDISPTITKRFAPDDVMTYNDNVEKISVTELKLTRKFLEVYIVEVFHPNFFWIHLRENQKRFIAMMNDLFEFYEVNKDAYTIPKVALKKDMNCACVYASRWHRGIIKTVKPDYKVTVLFYDYGTLKTYAAQDIYYLHKKFSALPAQAIPCGLHNIKPMTGERWKKSISDQFIDKIAETLLAATIITVTPKDNSMLVILTDTSEDEDVNINDWLVNERLALRGKTVRICDIHMYLTCDIEFSTSVSVTKAGSAFNVDGNQSISRDEKTRSLSDVKSENNEKKTKSLHNVSASRRTLVQKLWSKSPDVKSPQAKSPSSDAKSPHTKSPSPDIKSVDIKSPDIRSLNAKSSNRSLNAESPDTKSELRNYPQNGKSRTPKRVSLLEKVKTSRFNQKSSSNSSISMSKTNTDNEDNTKQTDSSMKTDSQNNRDDNSYVEGFMNFGMRDSDEENDNDFGTFRSLYGGRGLMQPFDWSLITEEHTRSKTNDTLPNNNVDKSIQDCKNDVKDKSGSWEQRNEMASSTAGKQFFLNMTRMEEENFLPENNIDYSNKNKSDFIETLRNNEVLNKIVTVMFTPNDKLKTLLNNVQSENVSIPNTNIVEHNNVTSSSDTDQEIDRNCKMRKTEADQKIENKDSNTDSKSVTSNISNNNDNVNREMSESSSDNSPESNTSNRACNSGYQTLLKKMRRKQMDSMNSSFPNVNESSSSEQVRSSYSCNSSFDTIISSNNEQSKASNQTDVNTHIKTNGLIEKVASTPEESPKNSILDESCNASEESRGCSSLETDSVTSSNDLIDDTKQRHQLNRSFDSTTSSSCKVDDSKCQLTAENQTLDIPKLMQRMLKIVQNIGTNNTELDSDDMTSSQESIMDNKSDESKGDDKSFKSDSISKKCELNGDVNVTEKALVPAVYDDSYYVESDDESEWDCEGFSDAEEIAPFCRALLQSSEISSQAKQITEF